MDCQHQKQLALWQALHAEAKSNDGRAEALVHIELYQANIARGGW